MNAIVDQAQTQGITRLCHFTKSANLAHILASRELLPVADLKANEDAYRPADAKRMDGALGHSFLSVEYPNTWYLSQASDRDPNFREWVILTLTVELLATPGAKFCPYNSARDRSAGARQGLDGFKAMFAPSVTGNTTRHREGRHPDWWPTDDQAEIQHPGPIPLTAVQSVIVRDEGQAELEYYRLAVHLGMAAVLPPLVVAPVIFNKYDLSNSVRAGRRPRETPYIPRTTLAE
ncbi:DUF4433 domain-containing protein [Streptomyces sp. col6]|uniref:DarT ssDNA thymidine ADP-ribosyltransferase family protein n=1 Tax=Streptomyces TaxID=1883 RepID=UPI0011CE0257|nr:DarT ssDNA thymidine ADP-ribosyltransferase family protein [Streptomyces sp. col6]TXS02934.1 DUF4433 domain-containing protein [Streptomyces sp. col6]